MSKAASSERQKIIKAFGANLILTNKNDGTDGAILKLQEIISKNPNKYAHLDQYSNKDNLIAHYKTTGPEIWKQTNGAITHLVAGIGTSGTILGIAKFLKEKNPNIRIIATQKDINQKIQGLKNMDESIIPKIFDKTKINQIINVKNKEAISKMQELSTKGLFVGESSGAALFVAEKIAKENPKSKIVTIFPDGGERYLSSINSTSHK